MSRFIPSERKNALYNKLRNAIGHDIIAEEQLIKHATERSQLRHVDSHVATVSQKLRLARNNFIIENCELQQDETKGLLNKIQRNPRTYLIMDIREQQKMPLQQDQLKIIIKRRRSEEAKVYKYANKGQDLGETKLTKRKKPRKKKYMQQANKTLGLSVTNKSFFEDKNKNNQDKKQKNEKFNLFSIIDQPINSPNNNENCTIFGNQIIASLPSTSFNIQKNSITLHKEKIMQRRYVGVALDKHTDKEYYLRLNKQKKTIQKPMNKFMPQQGKFLKLSMVSSRFDENKKQDNLEIVQKTEKFNLYSIVDYPVNSFMISSPQQYRIFSTIINQVIASIPSKQKKFSNLQKIQSSFQDQYKLPIAHD